MKRMTEYLKVVIVTTFMMSLAFWLALGTSYAHAQDIVVTKTQDTNDGACDADCSLREAIIAANQDRSEDTVVVPAGTFLLTIGGSLEDESATGDLDIRSDLILRGAGADQTIIDGSGLPIGDPERVLHTVHTYGSTTVEYTPTVTIENVTITGGDARLTSNFASQCCGGGIRSEGKLTLRHSKIVGNYANYGGGLYQAELVNDDFAAAEPLLIEDSLIADNLALRYGGGLATGNTADVTIRDSTIENNAVRGELAAYGGGLQAMGRITLINTTVKNNQVDALGTEYCVVGEGGGIYSDYGQLTLQDSLVIGNSVNTNGHEDCISTPIGGGIYHVGGTNASTIHLTNTQVMSNTAGAAGGIYVMVGGRIEESFIAYNEAKSFEPENNFDGVGGGLILLSAGMKIVNSDVIQNRAAADGGGIATGGGNSGLGTGIRVEKSLIAENHAGAAGGGVSGALTLVESTVRDNTAQRGAGLSLLDSNISGSLITGNQATQEGGGVALAAAYRGGPVVNIDNSTISGNKAERNAGISHGGPVSHLCETNGRNTFFQWGYGGEMSVTNTTVAANVASVETGGIYVNVENRDGESVSASECPNGYVPSLNEYDVTTKIANTLVAANNGDNCTNIGADVSKGHNLSDDATCLFTSAGDITKTPAMLGPLQDNGGPTLTHALLDGSPAIDAGDDGACPATDQRGVTRPRGPHCDIGAYEYVLNKPSLKVSPSAVTFVGVVGGSAPAAKSVQVLNDGIGNLPWIATESISWLSLSKTSGTAPADVMLIVDSSGLGVGTYMDDVTVSAAGVLGSPQSVKVTLQLIDAADLLKNGDFELGRIGWAESSTKGRALIRQGGDVPFISPHSGDWASALGQVDGETSELSQRLTLPAGGDLRLHYYGYARSTEINCTFEVAEVWIGQTKVGKHPLCQSKNSSDWTRHTIDLNPYKGKQMDLRFTLTNDGISDPSTFLVDDVSLELIGSTPTVRSNHRKGAPGSYFTISAEGFPPNAQAKILVNGVEIGTGQTDADGALQRELSTEDAGEGVIVVMVQVNPTAAVTIHLDANAPLRPKEDSGPLLNIPSGIVFTVGVFLPFVTR